MLATSVRVRPCSARSSPRSVGRVTVIVPSSCAIEIRCGTTCRSSPFGPCTVTRPGSTVTVTPAGTSMGLFPIRLIASPNEADDLATNTLLSGRAGRDHSARRREDRGTHAAEDARQAVLARVDPAAGLGDALQTREHSLAAAPVLELDHEHLVREAARRLDVV